MNAKRSRWWAMAVIVVLLAATSGSYAGAPSGAAYRTASPDAAVKLAILAPLTGSVSMWGRSARDGALLAIAQQNAHGGVLGMAIEPIVEDTACDATTAVAATNKVINQDGVRYIIGDVCSRSSIPMSEIADAAGVIQMTPTATAPGVTVYDDGRVKEYVFRAAFIDPYQGTAAARFARSVLAARRAFVLFDPDNPYSNGLAETFRAEFVKGGTIAGEATYSALDTDFASVLSMVKAADPEVIYLPDYYNLVNRVTRQARDMGIIAPFVGGDGWGSPDLDTAAAAVSYFTDHFSLEDPRPEVSAFDQAFRSQYGAAPDTIAALAYDAARLLFQAMSEANTVDTAVVKSRLAAIAFRGVTGTLFYDAQHNPIKSVAVMRVESDGVRFFALVPPMRPAVYLPSVRR
jgi:branched-chain amino acid transport system substrate-binding protein